MKAIRPDMPTDYGVPQGNKGLLPWSHVTKRMAEAKYYWICTVDPSGQPYVNPVDGLWLDDKLYFGGSQQTRWSKNLVKNPSLCVHLESGIDVVILRGEAAELREVKRELAERLSQASFEKYGYGPKPEDYEHLKGAYIFQPEVVLAWQQFPQDVTKWKIALIGDQQ